MEHKLTQEDIEARVKRGVELFKSGYNCAQAVVGAFADLYGVPQDVALRMSASFGGGMGRMRLTCGAASGMFLLAGLENGCATTESPQKRAENYALVQELAAEFKEENGSLTCAELLGLRTGKTESPTPNARTQEYYKNRPCAMMVESACRIFAKKISIG
jgi:C_GCAxxG_C_C family probable redox protein